LESSVAELHQMFLDFALLTEQQGELLDQIEFQVKQAGDYVEDGNVDVHQAIEYQSAIRKKQWYVFAFVIFYLMFWHFWSHHLYCVFLFILQLDYAHCYCMHCCPSVCHGYHSIDKQIFWFLIVT